MEANEPNEAVNVNVSVNVTVNVLKVKGILSEFCGSHKMINFRSFNKMLLEAYKESGIKNLSYQEVGSIFHFYFSAYQQTFGFSHKPMKKETLVRLIGQLDPDDTLLEGLDSECYQELILQHFNTYYGKGCDYSIAHFLSGEIRANRFYETMY